jgi:hypothetical protein
MDPFRSVRSPIRSLGLVLLGALLFATSGCAGDDGDQGPPGPAGNPGTDDELEQGDDLPGLVVAIQSLTGGSASGGLFRAGDTIRVNYRLQKTDGSDWDLAELSSGRALVSGPTFNYQRVMLEVTDLLTASVKQPTTRTRTRSRARSRRPMPRRSTTRRPSGPRTASSPASRCSRAPTRSA